MNRTLWQMRKEDRRVGRGVIMLYGVTDRDPEELVCQIFPNSKYGRDEMSLFVVGLPGTYNTMVVHNVDYDEITIGDTGTCPFVCDCSL